MKFAILYSKKDIAGINIAKQLQEHYLPQTPIIELSKDSINSEDIDKDPRIAEAEFLIFATKHQSAAGIPSLSLHAPGNWRNADYGGKPGKLCPTSNQAMKFLFQKLNENAKSISHKITLEATHHGPLINKPCCFIEIGSNEKHWQDPELAKIIAKTISDFQTFTPNRSIKTAIAIGSGHYAPNFTKLQLNSDIAIGHILPEYHFPVTESMIKEVLEKTNEHTDFILIDWKGCGNSEKRQKLIDLIEKLGLDWERTDQVKKN